MAAHSWLCVVQIVNAVMTEYTADHSNSTILADQGSLIALPYKTKHFTAPKMRGLLSVLYYVRISIYAVGSPFWY